MRRDQSRSTTLTRGDPDLDDAIDRRALGRRAAAERLQRLEPGRADGTAAQPHGDSSPAAAATRTSRAARPHPVGTNHPNRIRSTSDQALPMNGLNGIGFSRSFDFQRMSKPCLALIEPIMLPRHRYWLLGSMVAV